MMSPIYTFLIHFSHTTRRISSRILFLSLFFSGIPLGALEEGHQQRQQALGIWLVLLIRPFISFIHFIHPSSFILAASSGGYFNRDKSTNSHRSSPLHAEYLVAKESLGTSGRDWTRRGHYFTKTYADTFC